jgi:hypothetical protein
MPHPEENKMGGHLNDDVVVADSAFVASFDDLVDVLPNILGFLQPRDIMRQRRVCRKCSEAVKMTIVPLADFDVNSVEKYNRMVVMTRAMPNLQQITISYLHGVDWGRHKYNDGEDPNLEYAARTARRPTYDIEIISNFRKLRILDIYTAQLNGRYPFLFNSFPLLEKLSIKHCDLLKWDLEMLSGLPLLKDVECWFQHCLAGNINSLIVLKDRLERVIIEYCENIEGNFMDLADFPLLKELNLFDTAVKGDIREIGVNDFSSLEQLTLPKSVYGGNGYELHRISDAPDVVRAVYLFNKQRPDLLKMKEWYVTLSEDSPDWYESVDDDTPPFYINIVQAGSRIGYRWTTKRFKPCEVNWLDPEPDRESGDYEKCIEESQQLHSEVHMFRGLYQPPTEEEYHRLVEEEAQRRRAGRSERLTVG